jgi:hypothetical protein
VNNIKYLLLISILLSCSKNIKELDFCTMYKKDQSHLYDATKSEAENAEIKKKRKNLIYSNYNELKSYSNKYHFPQVDKSMQYTNDSCKYYSIFATLIHINQIEPEVFYSSRNIEFLADAIDKKYLDNNLVYPAVKIGSHSPYCKTLEPNIKLAIQKWKLPIKLLEDMQYIDCKIKSK